MVSFKLTTLALVASRALAVLAQAEAPLVVEDVLDGADSTAEDGKVKSSIAVAITASFPQSEIFGVKLVNGHPTRAVLELINNEPETVTLAVVGGSLLTPNDLPGAPDPPVIVRNLTTQRYGLELPPGVKETVTYSFATELHPQNLRLNLAAVTQSNAGQIFTHVVYNETVAVVEAPVSLFDPQIIFLYIFLAAAFAGTCYFIYSTWITTLFPQKRRGGKGGERAKRSSGGTKKVDPSEQVAVVGADGPAVTTGSKAYDESWIPAGHLKRPEAKRVGSGRPKSRAA